MRLLPLLLLLLLLTAWLAAAEPPYPPWDGSESVADYAKKVNLPPTKTLELGNGVKMELVLIPAGKFIMGTPEPTPVDEAGFQQRIVTGQTGLAVSAVALLVMLAVVTVRVVRERRRPQLSLALLLLVTVAAGGCVLGALHWRGAVQARDNARLEFTAAKDRFDAAEANERPAHPVTLTSPFYIGKFDVTQGQYQQIIGSNPSQFKGKDNPVEQISWDDAQAFCKKLREVTRQTIRLPTEAEWEFACRAGTATTYYSGENEADLGRVAWYGDNSRMTSHPVGQKDANAFGLYDMHGNVFQWCKDWYADDYYGNSSAEKPEGPENGDYRLVRGGSWINGPLGCRSAYRYKYFPAFHISNLGFRVLLPSSFSTP